MAPSFAYRFVNFGQVQPRLCPDIFSHLFASYSLPLRLEFGGCRPHLGINLAVWTAANSTAYCWLWNFLFAYFRIRRTRLQREGKWDRCLKIDPRSAQFAGLTVCASWSVGGFALAWILKYCVSRDGRLGPDSASCSILRRCPAGTAEPLLSSWMADSGKQKRSIIST